MALSFAFVGGQHKYPSNVQLQNTEGENQNTIFKLNRQFLLKLLKILNKVKIRTAVVVKSYVNIFRLFFYDLEMPLNFLSSCFVS